MICNNFTSSFDLSLFMAFPSRESINKKRRRKKMLLNYDLKARENVRIVRRKEKKKISFLIDFDWGA